jgi:hypothetical protein
LQRSLRTFQSIWECEPARSGETAQGWNQQIRKPEKFHHLNPTVRSWQKSKAKSNEERSWAMTIFEKKKCDGRKGVDHGEVVSCFVLGWRWSFSKMSGKKWSFWTKADQPGTLFWQKEALHALIAE